MQQPEIINAFVAELIKKAGLEAVPAGFYNEYFDRIGVEVQKRLGLTVMKELTPEAAEEFAKITEAGAGQTEYIEFFKKNIPDYEKKIEAALKEFADEFLSSAAKLEEKKEK